MGGCSTALLEFRTILRYLELEKAMHLRDLNSLQNLNAKGWYDFLHDEYFRWKRPPPNRYVTTTNQLSKYKDTSGLEELDIVRQQLLNLNLNEIHVGLKIATKIRGLGTAGASGLLSIMYPKYFATVDQFVVKALRLVSDLPESDVLS